MNENLNLCEVLKDTPVGTIFFSPLYGQINFGAITKDGSIGCYQTYIPCKIIGFKQDGRLFKDGECMIYPSDKQRDWSLYECPSKAKYKVGDWVRVTNNISQFLGKAFQIHDVPKTGVRLQTNHFGIILFGLNEIEPFAPHEGEFYVAYNAKGDYAVTVCVKDLDKSYSLLADGFLLYFNNFNDDGVVKEIPATEEQKKAFLNAVKDKHNKTYCEDTKAWVEMEKIEPLKIVGNAVLIGVFDRASENLAKELYNGGMFNESKGYKFTLYPYNCTPSCQCLMCGEYHNIDEICGCVAKLTKRVEAMEKKPKRNPWHATFANGTWTLNGVRFSKKQYKVLCDILGIK